MAGAGTIGGTSDSLHYAYQSLSGNGQITVRVSSMANAGAGAMAGILLRDGLAANPREVGLFLRPDGKIEFLQRTRAGRSASINLVTPPAGTQWLKLVRSGSIFVGYYSSDGANWNTAGYAWFSMPTTLDAGLAVCSGNTSTLTTASFDDLLLG